MNYIELKVSSENSGRVEILMAELAELGFESFVEIPGGLLAYVSEKAFPKEAVDILMHRDKDSCTFHIQTIAERNWNEEWEKNFEPVTIGSLCHIRAPFHPASSCKYEIIIEPKMSFGTGHHETTAMMIDLMEGLEISGKRVLDMGCGTGVLAILAAKMGAAQVVAIDNDEWAYQNTLENLSINQVAGVEAIQGDAGSLETYKDQPFDIILANINRNILLRDLEAYAAVLKEGGRILFSGFLKEDRTKLVDKARQFSIQEERFITLNQWMALLMVKIV